MKDKKNRLIYAVSCESCKFISVAPKHMFHLGKCDRCGDVLDQFTIYPGDISIWKERHDEKVKYRIVKSYR